MHYPKVIQNLIDKLTALPNVGPKTAERYVFSLLTKKEEELKSLASLIANLKSETTSCESCQAISETSPCPVCNDLNRDKDYLCIVENTPDYLALESTGEYHGQYFVLGGLLDTINDIKPSNLNIKELLEKLKKENIKEIILALSFTIEGETTALYLSKLLKGYKITRIAKGVPAGSNLEYTDLNTLASSLNNRKQI